MGDSMFIDSPELAMALSGGWTQVCKCQTPPQSLTKVFQACFPASGSWLQFLRVFWTLRPSLQETSEERPNNVTPHQKTAENASECSSAGSSALVLWLSPCLLCCCRGWTEWTEDDFLCDSGDGVTEPTLLSDDQLSQTLHCAHPPPAHHSFHFLLFCLC